MHTHNNRSEIWFLMWSVSGRRQDRCAAELKGWENWWLRGGPWELFAGCFWLYRRGNCGGGKVVGGRWLGLFPQEDSWSRSDLSRQGIISRRQCEDTVLTGRWCYRVCLWGRAILRAEWCAYRRWLSSPWLSIQIIYTQYITSQPVVQHPHSFVQNVSLVQKVVFVVQKHSRHLWVALHYSFNHALVLNLDFVAIAEHSLIAFGLKTHSVAKNYQIVLNFLPHNAQWLLLDYFFKCFIL